MNKYLVISALILLFVGCTSKNSENPNSITEESIFNLQSEWQNQNGETVKLTNYKGEVLVVVMIYTSCQSACPRLVADMRDIESKIPEKYLDGVKLILVSIDPETDTPERLKEFASTNQMSDPHWVFLRSNIVSTQEFANVLAVKYKQISPKDFSHSNIISVFDRGGNLVHQQEGLGVNNENTVNTIINTLKTK
ncbi:MAG: SCO family protein [Flavobacteriales bacterium]|nr:SCO family protein [Flavobacteriales bacterium]